MRKRMVQRMMLIGLFLLIVALGYVPKALAFTVIITDPKDIIRTSEVSTIVTNNQDGTFTYNYTVKNTFPAPQWLGIPNGITTQVWPMIVDYEVPLDSLSVVWDIKSPDGWTYEFISFSDYMKRYGEPNPF